MLGKLNKHFALGQPIDLPFSILDGSRPVKRFSVSAAVASPTTSVKHLVRQWNEQMELPSARNTDAFSKEAARAQAVRGYLRHTSGQDPFLYQSQSIHLVHPKIAQAANTSAVLRAPTSRTVDGTYNLRFHVQGLTDSGCPFTRVGFRSFLVA